MFHFELAKLQQEFSNIHGVRVVKVHHDSSAALAGIKENDIIGSFDGYRVGSVLVLCALLLDAGEKRKSSDSDEWSEGFKIKVSVTREDEGYNEYYLTVEFAPAARPPQHCEDRWRLPKPCQIILPPENSYGVKLL